MTIYDFEAKEKNGSVTSLGEYRGEVLLIVNTASKCGFTPQYTGLEALHRKYADKGLRILGFPCNQFAGQEPGSDEDIAAFCSMNYGVTFTLFSKVDVNGKNAHPLFVWLRGKTKGGLFSNAVKWNFTKFLVDRTGEHAERFAPTVTPEEMESRIEELLAKKN